MGLYFHCVLHAGYVLNGGISIFEFPGKIVNEKHFYIILNVLDVKYNHHIFCTGKPNL